jgi:hypothetical protein
MKCHSVIARSATEMFSKHTHWALGRTDRVDSGAVWAPRKLIHSIIGISQPDDNGSWGTLFL